MIVRSYSSFTRVGGDGDARCDSVLVLRGLSRYQPKPQHFNMMWNISHPDDVTIESTISISTFS